MDLKDILTPDVVTVAITREDGGLTIMRVITAEYQKPTRPARVSSIGPDGEEVFEPEEPLSDRILVRQHDVTNEYIEALIAKRYEPAPGHPNGVWSRENGKRAASWRFVPNDFVDETVDRTYRNAWKDSPGADRPGHDMVKARNVHRDILRRKRSREMDDLDIEYQRADEANDQNRKREVALRKQKLRDVTADPRIEAAQTVEDLKALTLEALTG